MSITKSYVKGEDQYIDLLKEFNFKDVELEVLCNGNEILLREKQLQKNKLNKNAVISQPIQQN